MLDPIHPKRVKCLVSLWQNQLLIEHVEWPEDQENDPGGAETNPIVDNRAKCLGRLNHLAHQEQGIDGEMEEEIL